MTMQLYWKQQVLTRVEVKLHLTIRGQFDPHVATIELIIMIVTDPSDALPLNLLPLQDDIALDESC